MNIKEMELGILLINNQPKAVKFLMSIYANSTESRRRFAHWLYDNPFSSGTNYSEKGFRNKPVDIMNNQMNSIGLNLNMVYESPKSYAKRINKNGDNMEDAINNDLNKVKNINELSFLLKREINKSGK